MAINSLLTKYSLLLAVAAHLSVSVSAGPLVTNSSNGVSYQGTSADSVEQFQNIFFSQSASGKHRFAPPRLYVPPRNATINATMPGAACPQPAALDFAIFDQNITNISEDCLSLRIARPANTLSTDKLPVMVWIYGDGSHIITGGFTFGHIYDPAYDPTGLVLQAVANGQPVIYAAVNYRVNIFGFASSDVLRHRQSLNVGLRDQLLGIQWVKDNIASFGGDPDNITIFGESDGGTSVGLQLTAYGGTRGAPFHRAIMQSGSAASATGVNSNTSAESYAAVANITNCTSDGPGSDETLACLRSLPMDLLLNISMTYAYVKNPPVGVDVYFPVVDDDFVPAAPSSLIKSGRFLRDISVIAGWAADDGTILIPSTIGSDSAVASFLAIAFPGLSDASVAHIQSLYPVSDFEFQVSPHSPVDAQFYRAARIFRDIVFTCPSIDLSYHIMKYSNLDAWLYELNQTALANLFEQVGLPYVGVAHFSDVPYVFNSVAAYNGSISDTVLATQMSGNWSAFAATGIPTTAKSWPVAYPRAATGLALRPGPVAHLHIDHTSPRSPKKAIVNVIGGPYAGPARISKDSCDGPVGMEKLLLRCAFLNSIYDQIRT